MEEFKKTWVYFNDDPSLEKAKKDLVEFEKELATMDGILTFRESNNEEYYQLSAFIHDLRLYIEILEG